MKGYRRRFRAEGLNLERLILRAGADGIRLQRMRRKGSKLSGIVAEGDLTRLRILAEQGGWRLQSGERVGMGRIEDWLCRRVWLVIGCLLTGIAVVAAAQMMWRVDVVDGGIYEADIRQYLSEKGIHPLQWKRQIDLAALRDELEWRYPQIAWVEVGWRGVTLQIRIAEGTPSGKTISISGACDVVALRDGIVTSVVTVAGTPQVTVGEIVRKGQVLIQGVERVGQEQSQSVAARGCVQARVWDAAAVTMSVWETETVYTGRRYETVAVTLPWFPLWKGDDAVYDQEDVAVRLTPLGGIFLPAVIRQETHMEAKVNSKKRSAEQVKGEAGVAALRKLRQKIGNDDDLVDKWVEFAMIESEQVYAVAYGERIIDIARQDR